MLYFSYGSNMSVRRLRQRVPSALVVTMATLERHELRFHKRSHDGSAKCDAFHTGDALHSITGVVFRMDPAEKPQLDRAEGLGVDYAEKEVNLVCVRGEPLRATTYYALQIDAQLIPYHWYKHHVLTGASENGLPPDYVDQIASVESLHDPLRDRHEREMAIYAGDGLQGQR